MFSSSLQPAPLTRPRFEPDASKGLRVLSELMVDLITSVRRSDIGKLVGFLTQADLRRAERAVLMMLGFG